MTYGETNVSNSCVNAVEKHKRIIDSSIERSEFGKVVIPINLHQLNHLLRSIGEPITLFGENEPLKRSRLKKLIAGLSAEKNAELIGKSDLRKILTNTTEAYQTAKFYTKGTTYVENVRLWLAEYSLALSKARIARQLEIKKTTVPKLENVRGRSIRLRLSKMANSVSEVVDDRPVSCCSFSHDGNQILTASWTGSLKVWSVPDCTHILTIKAHNERITGLATNPEPDLVTTCGPAFATGSADRTARLWTSNGTLISTLSGHEDRLGRVAFHPSGRLLATASFDHCWRLWDLDRASTIIKTDEQIDRSARMVYTQEGHSRPVYTISFHCDGSLLASGGLDAIGRVWDIRSGHNILTLEGHTKPILALDFSPDGYHIITGSSDNSCQVWDLRKARSCHLLSAHKKLVSHVKYHPGSADYFVTASYDNEIKVWSAHDYRLIRVLKGHENKVMGFDIHPYSDFVASVSYDRTLKLWLP